MINFQQDVKDWMILAQQEIPNKPTIPTKEVIDLRIKLIQEELDELKENPADLVNAADAFADLLYVVYGAAISYGLDINPIWTEVHRSNMTKFIDGHRREDGKWIKGPSYSPANLEKVVEDLSKNK